MPASKNTINVLEHKRLVASYLEQTISDLITRAITHDDSKFSPEEFDAYEEALPRFEQAVYASEEYKQICRDIKPAIKHHVTLNRHHIEFFGEAGITGMNLIDLLEMTCDWLAASQRSGGNGDIEKGLEINRERYGLSEQLYEIIKNTIRQLDPGKFQVIDPLI